MTVSEDLDLTRRIRRVFVKHWIDLGRIAVRCHRGRIYLTGTLLRISESQPRLDPKIVDAMFYEIKRLPGVKLVNARLENWINDSGKWREFNRHGDDPAAGRSDEE